MSVSLGKIKEIIESNFPYDWENKYWENDKAENIPNDKYLPFQEKLLAIKEDIFNLLNISLLTGEYVINDKYEVDLKNIELSLEKIPIPYHSSGELYADFTWNFIATLKKAVEYYSNFVVWFRLKIIYKEGNHLFPTIDEQKIEKLYDDISAKQLLLFKINIHISKLDFALDPEVKNFNTLYEFIIDLSSGNLQSKHSFFLREKCYFLLYKWIVRNRQRTGLIYSLKRSYEERGNYRDMVSELYTNWRRYLDAHGEFTSNWKVEVSQGYSDTRYKPLSELSLKDIHLQIKYFKDVTESYENLKLLREELSRRFDLCKGSSTRYKFFVYSIALNYAFNNEFSLAVDTEYLSDENIDKLYQVILDIQAQTSIKNYFPQHKYIVYLISKLRKQTKERIAISELKSQRILLDKCNKVIKDYEENVKWCEKNYNYTFYLPYEECLLETEKPAIKQIFIASSFEIPVDKRHYTEQFDKFKREISNIENSIEIFENVESEIIILRQLKEDVVEIKKDIVNKETKSMETIALFTTIVTFVLASVTEFKFVTTAYQAALFTICLAISLGFFVLILILVRQGDFFNRARKYLYDILFLIVIGLVAWTAFIYSKQIIHYLRIDTPAYKSQSIAPDSIKPKQNIKLKTPKP